MGGGEGMSGVDVGASLVKEVRAGYPDDGTLSRELKKV